MTAPLRFDFPHPHVRFAFERSQVRFGVVLWGSNSRIRSAVPYFLLSHTPSEAPIRKGDIYRSIGIRAFFELVPAGPSS